MTRVVLAQINPIVGDLEQNAQKIIGAINKARQEGGDLVVFPELALCGYPPDDFLFLSDFIQVVESTFERIVEATDGIAVIVGLPRVNTASKGKPLFNSAALIENKRVIGFQDKSLLPTYDVFDEARYFEPALESHLWKICGLQIGVTICEDIWPQSEGMHFHQSPIDKLKKLKPELLVNLSASPFQMERCHRRISLCSETAKAIKCPVLYCNQVGGNDSLIFDGYSLHVDSEGHLNQVAKGFEEDFLTVDLTKTYSPCFLSIDKIEDLYHALVLGLRDYFHKLDFRKACLGVSGGIDSAVVACIAKDALGIENVLGITMPSRFSSEEGRKDGETLLQNLGIERRDISIEAPFKSFLDLLEPEFEGKPYDVTEENIQARIRGTILMAFSNKYGHIVLSTGNKSEMAMGYSTLYGDMVGGLGVLSDVTKMHVYALARWINRKTEVIPNNIIHKPPSAELRHNQLDSDSLPAYEIVDKVLESYVEDHMSPKEIAERYNYSLDLVKDLVRKIHFNEYKRRQSAPGLRVSRRAFSVGRRFPIVQRWV